MWGSQQVVKCGWYNLHHDPVCIAKKRNLGRSWNIVEKNQGAKRAGIGANRAGIPIPLISKKDKLSFCGARKPSIRTFMLLQTRTCETVDCMVITSQHRISSKPDQNPFMREKDFGQNRICQGRNSSWAEIVALGSYRYTLKWALIWFPPIKQLGLICWDWLGLTLDGFLWLTILVLGILEDKNLFQFCRIGWRDKNTGKLMLAGKNHGLFVFSPWAKLINLYLWVKRM